MNKYFRVFNDVSITQDDVDKIKGIMKSHREDQILDYHGYLDIKTTLRTGFAKDIKDFAEKLDLRLAGIYAFTAHAGAITRVHTDGDSVNGPLPWRLSYYVEGEPGTLAWYEDSTPATFDTHVAAYINDQTLSPIYTQDLAGVSSAFVRTEIPHRLDISQTKTDRLTITATFLPRISWEELNYRLDKLNEN